MSLKPPDRVNVNPYPKEVLLGDSRLVGKYRDLMQSPDLVRGIELALAQYQRVLADKMVADGSTAAAYYFKIQGAHELISTLKGLGESPRVQTTKIAEPLNHKV